MIPEWLVEEMFTDNHQLPHAKFQSQYYGASDLDLTVNIIVDLDYVMLSCFLQTWSRHS